MEKIPKLLIGSLICVLTACSKTVIAPVPPVAPPIVSPIVSVTTYPFIPTTYWLDLNTYGVMNCYSSNLIDFLCQ